MKTLLGCMLAAVVALGGLSRAQSTEKENGAAASAREKLIGAWRLVSLEVTGEDGKVTRIPDLEGMLLYTRDGHISVQLMYPKSASALTNDYVKNGYEASYGSYDVNEVAHTVTHHVQGSITENLVCRCSKIMSPPNCNETLSPLQDGDDESERVPTGESDCCN